jgi:putative flippase GtrA
MRVVRFAANGVLATAVHYFCLFILLEILQIPLAGVASGLASISGIITSYFGNKNFVFASKSTVSATLPKFLVSYVAVALIHFTVLTTWTDILHQDYTIGFLGATSVSAAVTYVTNAFFVFTGTCAMADITSNRD